VPIADNSIVLRNKAAAKVDQVRKVFAVIASLLLAATALTAPAIHC
jgi:hypothetical protein